MRSHLGGTEHSHELGIPGHTPTPDRPSPDSVVSVPSNSTRSEFSHRPALLEECLAALELQPGAIVVDGTVGGGGHAAAILERTAPDGRLIGLDLDGEAIRESQRRLEGFGDRATLVHAHVEGCLFGGFGREAEAALRGVELMRRDSEIE